MASLEAGQAWTKRLEENSAHLEILDDNEFDLRLRQYQPVIGQLRMGKGRVLEEKVQTLFDLFNTRKNVFQKIYTPPATFFYYGYGLVCI